MESGASQQPAPIDAQPPPRGLAPVDKNALREKVRELSTVSGDLEMLTRQLARPHSTVQVGLLHERMDQLTKKQRTLVLDIARTCPDDAMQARFDGLDRRLEALRAEVQETRDGAELERYRAEIDPLVDEWARLFQDMVVVTLQS
jgi:hypothetical protein